MTAETVKILPKLVADDRRQLSEFNAAEFIAVSQCVVPKFTIF
jgi:hypothetical protein